MPACSNVLAALFVSRKGSLLSLTRGTRPAHCRNCVPSGEAAKHLRLFLHTWLKAGAGDGGAAAAATVCV